MKRFLTIVLYFIVVTFVAQGREVVVGDTLRFQFHFRLDKSDYDPSYLGNAQTMQDLKQAVADPDGIYAIHINSQSSPEGPYQHNLDLSVDRAASLYKLMQQELPALTKKMTVTPAGESWGRLRRYVLNDSIISRQRKQYILDIIDSDASPAMKKKAMQGLQEYEYLRQTYYPLIRNSVIEVLLVAEVPEVEVPEHPKPNIPVVQWPETRPNIYAQLPSPTLVPSSAILTERSPWFFAAKTNLLFDAAACANLGIELQLWNHASLDLPVWYSPYDITDKMRIRLLAIQPELRYWPRRAGQGFYVGVHTHVVGFNISFPNTDRYQDPNHAAWGLGVGVGYALNFGAEKHWGLEFMLGAGFVDYKYDTYLNKHNGKLIRQHDTGRYWGVTRAGINLTYRWYAWRKHKKVMIWQ